MLVSPSIVNDRVLWSGSARACGIDDFRQFCENSGLIESASGHPLAFGAAIYEENIE